MDLQHNTNQIPVIRHPKPETLGCAIIDAAGREVPITEESWNSDWSSLRSKTDSPKSFYRPGLDAGFFLPVGGSIEPVVCGSRMVRRARHPAPAPSVAVPRNHR